MPVHDESLSAEPLATANGTRPAPAPPAPATRTTGGAILRRPADRLLGRVPARWRAPVAVYRGHSADLPAVVDRVLPGADEL